MATSATISFSDPKKKALQRECCPHGVNARHFIFASICFQPCFSATICDLVLSKFRRRLSPFCKAVVDFNWAPQGHVDRVPPWPGLGKVHRKKLILCQFTQVNRSEHTNITVCMNIQNESLPKS